MTRTWKSAEDQFMSWWVGKDHFCFQFPDTRAAMGNMQSTKVFTGSHPSDFLVTTNGEMFYAEVKSSSNATSFPFSGIRPSQWSAAKRQIAAGGKYFFFLFSQSNGQWYRIPGSFLVSIYNEGRKSVKWAELTDFLWHPPQ